MSIAGSDGWRGGAEQKGLQFLNGDCQLVHGNVTLSSIFVSKAGDWKLGGLEFVSSPSESAPALKVPHHRRLFLFMGYYWWWVVGGGGVGGSRGGRRGG